MDDSKPPSQPLANDVVLVFERTNFFRAHLSKFKESYMHPMLEVLCGDSGYQQKPLDPQPIFGLVAFSALESGIPKEVLVKGPFNTSHALISAIEKYPFATEGHQETHSPYILPALVYALKCCKYFRILRNSPKSSEKNLAAQANKHIILMCNCEPFDILPPESDWDLDGESKRDKMMLICSEMIKEGIHFSVFSPRKRLSFRSLFLAAGGDLSNEINYAQDEDHLVLLSGFSLQANQTTRNEFYGVSNPFAVPYKDFEATATSAAAVTYETTDSLVNAATGTFEIPVAVTTNENHAIQYAASSIAGTINAAAANAAQGYAEAASSAIMQQQRGERSPEKKSYDHLNQPLLYSPYRAPDSSQNQQGYMELNEAQVQNLNLQIQMRTFESEEDQIGVVSSTSATSPEKLEGRMQ